MTPPIEVRYVTRHEGVVHLDELVAYEAVVVHLEQMSETTWSLLVETRHESVTLMLGTVRAPVTAHEFERTPINRRAEAQRKRWAAVPAEQRKRRRPISAGQGPEGRG